MKEIPKQEDRLERIERTLKNKLSEIKAVIVTNRMSLENTLEECIERIESIEKRLENMPEEIEQRIDVFLDAYQDGLIEYIRGLMDQLGDSLDVLLDRSCGIEKIEQDLQSLTHDTDVAIDEVRDLVTSLSGTLEDIKSTVYEIRERMDDA